MARRRIYRRRPRRNYRNKARAKKQFVRKVKRAMNTISEQKWFDSATATNYLGKDLTFDKNAAASTPVNGLLQDLAGASIPEQGPGAHQMVGERIRLRHLQVRGTFIPATDKGAARIIIGQSVEAESALSYSQGGSVMNLTYGDVLVGLDGTTGYNCISAMYNHEPIHKYKILADEVFTWDTNSGSSAPRLFNLDTRRFKIYNVNVENPVSGLAGTTCTGSIFYILASTGNVACTLTDCFARSTYVDY